VPPSIFFSHSARDLPWCEWLAAEAEKLGIAVYLAEHDKQPGRSLTEKVERNIKRCDALVVLLTASTTTSSYVHQEIGFARAQNKLVIPLVQPGVGTDQLSMLAGAEYIDFDFQNPHGGKEDLLAALNALAERQRKQDQVETLLAVGACIVLIVLLLNDGDSGPGAGPA
jgi:nucleoside 2-deoxyribosyltransferase